MTTTQNHPAPPRPRIRDVRDIVTTDSETKEQLIARVRELLQE